MSICWVGTYIFMLSVTIVYVFGGWVHVKKSLVCLCLFGTYVPMFSCMNMSVCSAGGHTYEYPS